MNESHTNEKELTSEYKLEPTRKAVETLQAQVQLLTMRVELLERQMVGTAQQNQTSPMTFAPSAQVAMPTASNVMPSRMYYWAQGFPNANGFGMTEEDQYNPNGSPSARQVEESLNRLGILPALGIKQQQLSMLMAQKQRDDAILAMLQGQSTPAVTPTALGSGLYPSPTSAIQQQAINAEGMPFHSPFATPAQGMAFANTNAVPGAGDPRLFSPTSTMPNTGINSIFNPITSQALSTTITLDPGRATNESLEQACQQPWIKELCLKGCKNLSNLNQLSQLRNLWKLNLQGCTQFVDDSTVKLISTYNKRLSRLNLCGCELITDASPLSQLSFLFDLNLSGCQIGNESLIAIAGGCSQLSRLAINSCPKITNISCVGKLRELKLLYCRYSGNIAPESVTEVMKQIGNGLLTLNVDGFKFEDLDVSQFPAVTTLKNFNLKDNVEVVSLAWLTSAEGASKKFGALEMLDVEGCANLIKLGDLSVLPSLKVLRLSHTAIDQSELLTLNACKSLTALYIEGCQRVQQLSSLVHLPSLSKVVIDHKLAGGTTSTVNGIQDLSARGVEVVVANNAVNPGHRSGQNVAHSNQSPALSPTNSYIPPIPSAAPGGKVSP
ncbi:unnamed protein product [Phytomonas sp. EM1]|nr:unnamed protein product [Phytomonas sp. EM1]|eukprot:CCW60509.1 unnamed protein product [Phytomonas sp. isolate EM1]